MSGNGAVYLFTVTVSAALLYLILDLIRRRHLKEKYALLWLATALVLLVFAANRSLVEVLAHVLGIYYAPSALFLLGFLFILALNLQYSVALSRQSERVVRLAQEVALLRQQLDELSSGLPQSVNREKENGRKSGYGA
ncbi:MAG: DUF2304 domain-containing protein [Bacillota bacterium]